MSDSYDLAQCHTLKCSLVFSHFLAQVLFFDSLFWESASLVSHYLLLSNIHIMSMVVHYYSMFTKHTCTCTCM